MNHFFFPQIRKNSWPKILAQFFSRKKNFVHQLGVFHGTLINSKAFSLCLAMCVKNPKYFRKKAKNICLQASEHWQGMVYGHPKHHPFNTPCEDPGFFYLGVLAEHVWIKVQ